VTIEVNYEAYSCSILRTFKKIWLFNLRHDMLISTWVTTVKSNLRIS